MSNIDLYNIINKNIHPKTISPLINNVANDMFSLIEHMDQTVGMFDMLLNHEPQIEIHLMQMSSFDQNPRYSNQDQRKGPIIEILDDSVDNNKKILQLEPPRQNKFCPKTSSTGIKDSSLHSLNQVTSKTCLPKTYDKWILKQTSKSIIGMLNDFELDIVLDNAFKVI